MRDALQAGGQVPEQALVDAAAIEERIDDQFPGVAETRDGGGSVEPAVRQSTARSAAAARARSAAAGRAPRPCAAPCSHARAASDDRRGAGLARPALPCAGDRVALGFGFHARACSSCASPRLEARAGARARRAAGHQTSTRLIAEALEVGRRILGIEDLAVEERLLAARGRGRNFGGGNAERPWRRPARCPRG